MTDFTRDGNGNPRIIPPNTRKPVSYQRPSGWGKALESTFALDKWSQRTTAVAIAKHPDIIEQLAGLDARLDRDTVEQLISEAREAATVDAAADIGTTLHRMSEEHDTGQTPLFAPLPDQQAWLDQYAATMAASGLQILPEWVETQVVNDDLRLAGTADRYVKILDAERWWMFNEGDIAVADIKTGANIHYSWLSILCQLAIYANADCIYDPADDSRHPLPVGLVTHRGIIIHAPADATKCDLWAVDLEHGWQLVKLADDVREVRRSAKKWAVPVTPTPTPDADDPFDGLTPIADNERLQWLRGRVKDIIDMGHGHTLAAFWPTDVPTLKQGGHTADQLDQLAAYLDGVGADTGEQLTVDPTTPRPTKRLDESLFDQPETRPQPSPADPHHIDQQRAMIEAATPDVRQWLDQWAAEAAAAGLSLHLDRATTDTIHTIRAATHLAYKAGQYGYDHSDVRLIIAAATDGEQHDDTPIGALLADLTPDEASQAAQYAGAYGTDSLELTVSTDGLISLTWTNQTATAETNNQESTHQ